MGASDLADGYLARQLTLPLSEWGDDLRRHVCAIAAYDLMTQRGYNPEGGDSNLRLRYEDAVRWLERVASGTVRPAVTDSTPTSSTAMPSGPVVRTSSKRGW